ncbi:MAG: aldehyde dehydrogenase (NADP(+)) [Acidimicrobiia bacterium]|nr:aldehyde dehydrogenase (NADP(+)) [Acidimicrobiia bacterium]
MSAVVSTDARTRSHTREVAVETTFEELDSIVAAAAHAGVTLAALNCSQRAAALSAMADALAADRAAIVDTADQETGLGVERLNGELDRTTGQLAHFAEVVVDGGYLEVTIDRQSASRPELRRYLRPIGPVAVFGASNFPLAFSVPGGDTVSALAAGCPVVIKAHPSHPATSIRCASALRAGLATVGLPPATIGLVHGTDAGSRLVSHPIIAAVGFTGSLHGGRALFDLANARDEPIPFYGELGSLNPVIVTDDAAQRRGEQIASDFVDSFTLGGGQFCTKPGLVFIPALHAETMVDTIRARVRRHEPTVLLNASIASNYADHVARLVADGIDVTSADQGISTGTLNGASVAIVNAQDIAGGTVSDLTDECFGPFAVVVIYRNSEDLHAGLAHVPKSLTASIHGEETDADQVGTLLALLEGRAGRIVWNGFPTGVSVTWAMHHGGPYPASTSPLHTSVGAAAIRRWLRPIAYQNVPAQLLPQELRDSEDRATPQRVDGVLRP